MCDKCHRQGDACDKQAKVFTIRAPAVHNVHTRSDLENINHTQTERDHHHEQKVDHAFLTNFCGQSLTRGTSRCQSGRSPLLKMPGTQTTCNSLTPDTQGGKNLSSKTWSWAKFHIKSCQKRRNENSRQHSNHALLVGREAEAEGAAHIQGFAAHWIWIFQW